MSFKLIYLFILIIISYLFLECYTDLTSIKGTVFSSISSSSKEILTENYDIFSKYSWCSYVTSATKVFQIDLGDLRVVSGFVVSGNTDSNSWITGFNVRFGLDSANLQTTKVGSVSNFCSILLSCILYCC